MERSGLSTLGWRKSGKLGLVNQCKANLPDANRNHMQKLISYVIRAIVTWAASFEELQLFFDYIYRLAGT